MMAVLGAVAGFFGGLALGAFVLDRPIRRSGSPWTVYAALEAVIGLWGLINIWLLPVAGRAIAPLLGTEPAPALLWAASFALPALVLLPATAAMGGTLIALERMMSEARADARVSAGVYGANTAGAVAGLLAGHLLAAIGAIYMQRMFGTELAWWRPGWLELAYFLGVIVVSLFAGLVPAMKAYQTPVAENLVAA